MVLVLGCSFRPQTRLVDTSVTDGTREFEWTFNELSYSWEVPIPYQLYQDYRARPRRSRYDIYITDTGDDEYIRSLCLKIEETDVRSDWSGKIDFVLSFVQSLEYSEDGLTGFDEYPRYPIETLYEQGGDCEDTAILFVSIVRELGYGAVLLKFDGSEHMAAGVKISDDVIDTWPKGYTLTYYSNRDNNYAYCETTGSGWRIGERPNWIAEESAVVIEV
jgi:hypothetical protein